MADPSDVDTPVGGIGILRRIVASDPVASDLSGKVEPGDGLRSHDALVDYVRTRTGLGYHEAGSCRMGPGDGAVVSPDLKVRGLENLWIADASVIPHMTGGNVNAACMMIGEKLGRQLANTARSA